MKYITHDGKNITSHFVDRAKHQEAIEVEKFNGLVGDPIDWYNDKWERISDEELIKAGIRQDNRGIYYNIETKGKKVISKLDESLDNKWTKEEPFEFCKWNKTKKIWILDEPAQTEAKQKAYESEKALLLREAVIKRAEYEVLSDPDAMQKSQDYYKAQLLLLEEKYK